MCDWVHEQWSRCLLVSLWSGLLKTKNVQGDSQTLID